VIDLIFHNESEEGIIDGKILLSDTQRKRNPPFHNKSRLFFNSIVLPSSDALSVPRFNILTLPARDSLTCRINENCILPAKGQITSLIERQFAGRI
jgi:hypothetical protein